MVACVLIPFLAGLLFGRRCPRDFNAFRGLNPLFGGSAFRTMELLVGGALSRLNPLFGGSAFRTPNG